MVVVDYAKAQNERKHRSRTIIFKKVSRASGDENCPVPINLKAFTFNDLKTATQNFRPDSMVGEGGFGRVFKGWIDETTLAPAKPGCGQVIAVKVLKSESHQGHREWLVSNLFSFPFWFSSLSVSPSPIRIERTT